jgi:hypothetical protein
VKKFLGSLALLVLLLVPMVPVASADEEWCSDDPPRVLSTPRGNAVVVYETLSARGDLYLADLTAALVATTYAARNYQRDGAGDLGTVFTLSVPVPNDLLLGTFAARAFTSSLPFATGTIYASAVGSSGTTLTMTFQSPLP